MALRAVGRAHGSTAKVTEAVNETAPELLVWADGMLGQVDQLTSRLGETQEQMLHLESLVTGVAQNLSHLSQDVASVGELATLNSERVGRLEQAKADLNAGFTNLTAGTDTLLPQSLVSATGVLNTIPAGVAETVGRNLTTLEDVMHSFEPNGTATAGIERLQGELDVYSQAVDGVVNSTLHHALGGLLKARWRALQNLTEGASAPSEDTAEDTEP